MYEKELWFIRFCNKNKGFDMKLRFITVYDENGGDIIDELQYWDEEHHTWTAIPSVRMSQKDYERSLDVDDIYGVA